MRRGLYCFAFVITLEGILAAQSGPARYNLDFGPTGVFPLSGFRNYGYSAGPGWRGGSELRLIKHLGAEAGFTEGWPVGIDSCASFGCTYSRQSLKLLDYGLRGVAPVAGGRLELSVGLGGGYILYPRGFYRPNQTLFQYSGKIALALDRLGRTRLTFAVRTWRDLGRPTTQWLSTAAGISYAFGHSRR
jgi:hypothetical protein